MLEATLLEQVPRDEPLCAGEAFGPVAVLSRFHSFDQALRDVNDSVFGLQAGIFTRDLYKMQKAWDELDVGGVVIGDIPSWRVDKHALWGRQRQWFGPRRNSLCHGRHDRDPKPCDPNPQRLLTSVSKPG